MPPADRPTTIGDAVRRQWSTPVGPARGGPMAAIDDLTELVERAAAVERTALSSKWKDESDVHALIATVANNAEEQRQAVMLDTHPGPALATLGRPAAALPRPRSTSRATEPRTARAAAAGASYGNPGRTRRGGRGRGRRMALTDAALAVLQARLASIRAGEDERVCGDDRRWCSAARQQSGQPARPGPRPRPARRDQVHADAQTTDHGEEPGHHPGPGLALPRLDPAVRMGHRPQMAALPGPVGDLRGHGWHQSASTP